MNDSAGTILNLIRESEAAFPIPDWHIQRMKHRRWVLDLVKKNGIGAEIGVFRGCFAAEICAVARPRKLYLIDPWTKHGETYGWGGPYTAYNKLTTQTARSETKLRMARFPEVETVMIEGWYPSCHKKIKEPLDYAYIDSSHRYDATLRELIRLDAQVKPDGLILGDDWYPDPKSMHHGVFQAVNEFVRDYDWNILSAGPGNQWVVNRTG